MKYPEMQSLQINERIEISYYKHSRFREQGVVTETGKKGIWIAFNGVTIFFRWSDHRFMKRVKPKK